MLTLLVLLHAPPTPTHEVARLEAWFAQAAAIVEAQPTDLTPGQAQRRAALLDTLDGYVSGGLFPGHAAGEWTPVFVDDDGTRCAVAHLLEMTGEDDLMWQVAATQNRAEVIDLINDPDFAAWLEWHGLTHAEAAAIQPTYPPPPIWSCICGGDGWSDDLVQLYDANWRTVVLVEPADEGEVRVIKDFNTYPAHRSWLDRVVNLEPVKDWRGQPPWLVAVGSESFAAQLPLKTPCPDRAPYPGPPKSLTNAQMARAALANQSCPDVLIAIDPRWSYGPDCGCDVGRQPSIPWTLLLGSAGLILGRVRRRPSPPRR